MVAGHQHIRVNVARQIPDQPVALVAGALLQAALGLLAQPCANGVGHIERRDPACDPLGLGARFRPQPMVDRNCVKGWAALIAPAHGKMQEGEGIRPAGHGQKNATRPGCGGEKGKDVEAGRQVGQSGRPGHGCDRRLSIGRA